MSRSRWLIGLLSFLVLATTCLNQFSEQRNSALADDEPTKLLKRIESLEARAAMLEGR